MEEMKEVILYDKLKNFRRLNRWDGLYGIEIETETLEEYSPPVMPFWESKEDGSLRNFGIEYVLKTPMDLVGITEALHIFKNETSHLDFIKDSATTSVHVHMNMLNETVRTFANILTLYALVENLLLRFSGETRQSNLFCLGMSDAEQTLINIRQLLKSFENLYWGAVADYTDSNAKYAAVNIATLGKFGSLEFRSFRGETDIDKILEWVFILDKIYQYCKQDLYPLNIINQWYEREFDFLEEVFGEIFPKIVLDREEDLPLVMRSNFWYATTIASSIEDWKVFLEKPKVVVKKETVEQKSLENFGVPFQELRPDQLLSLYNQLFPENNRDRVNTEVVGWVDHVTGRRVVLEGRFEDFEEDDFE